MQTFLPYPDFEKSLKSLDAKRLGNQVYREGLTLARGGWSNHPASKMWQGHIYQLCNYCIIGIGVLLHDRGLDYTHHIQAFLDIQLANPGTGMPSWLGNEDFHRSHQSNLIRKDPDHYGPQFPGVPDNLPYIWPKP